MWVFSNGEPAYLGKAYLFFEQGAHIAALTAGSTISMRHQYPIGHITEAPGCFRCSVMCDNVVSTFNCGQVTIKGQSQHRDTSAMILENAPHLTRNATFQPWTVREVFPEWVISEMSCRTFLVRV